MLAAKHREWVLQTIDRLRQRKARPDLERISRMVERFHGLTFSETQESLEKLVDKKVIMKVHFKGNISYRRCMKTFKDEADEAAFSTGTRIVHALKYIMKQTGDGASLSDLEKWLVTKNPDTRLVKQRLETALERQIQSRVITKLSDGCYVLTQSLPKLSKKAEETPPQYPPVEKQKSPSASSSSTPGKYIKVEEGSSPDTLRSTAPPKKDAGSESKYTAEEKGAPKDAVFQPEAKRGRPPSKRKKFKKTHGPDFETLVEVKKLPSEVPFEMKKTSPKDNEIYVCAFCSVTEKITKHKDVEPLLTCKECNVHAHPSCMDYSEELALRALNSPWQCMDCKTCCVCEGSDNAEVLLFCDACDKGYHMSCHEPPVPKQPKGKWVCTTCKHDLNKVNSQDQRGKKSLKSDRTNDSFKEEETETSERRRRGRKRGLSQQLSFEDVKRQKSLPSLSNEDLSASALEDKVFEDFTDGTAGASCLPTPSASPRHGDTFDYEMKMSISGIHFPLSEDETQYSDATEWTIDQVVKFFEECGFQDQAFVFEDQEIDGRSLLLMQRNDVLTGLALKLGPALKIYKKIMRLQLHSQAVS